VPYIVLNTVTVQNTDMSKIKHLELSIFLEYNFLSNMSSIHIRTANLATVSYHPSINPVQWRKVKYSEDILTNTSLEFLPVM